MNSRRICSRLALGEPIRVVKLLQNVAGAKSCKYAMSRGDMLPGQVSGTCCGDTSIPWCALALFLWCNVNSEQNLSPHVAGSTNCWTSWDMTQWQNFTDLFFFFGLVAVVFQALCIPQNCLFLELWKKHSSLPYKLEGVIDRNTQLVVVDWFVNEGRHLLFT